MTIDRIESAEQLTGVAETLMITLYARYLETQRSDRVFRDPKAVAIVERTRYNFEKYAKGWASQLGVVIRVREFDRLVTNFLKRYRGATVINLGCGLCTRFERVDNGSVCWYDVDFPEVIEFRRKFFKESDRNRFMATSILEFAWLDDIKISPQQPVLIVMEGVSMYLTEEENRAIVSQLQARFPQAEFVFDVISSSLAKRTKIHDTVSQTDAEFQFGIDRGRTLESWGEGIALENEIYYLEQYPHYPKRLPWWAKLLSPALLLLFKNNGRILHLKFSSNR
ncbi:class I SAM-dependent methyltransferase [Baaleninema simplex]|uniref:class I SAM-dependent methyltransferase n=1 Tax=Baaleninema simplex TaxID=2862350 RepID=UPI00034874B3|nr:class I SAM-dependent methyltransferase [Baaleninema simplex]